MLERAPNRLAWPTKRSAIDRGTVHHEMLTLATDWRRVLLGEAIEARPILRELLVGRVTITPTKPKAWEMRGR